jgi:hypothetical protein
VLDIVVYNNITVSDVIFSEILESDHLPILFHILDHVKFRNLSEPIEKFTDWERFQSLASELNSPRIDFNSGVEADKAARDITASINSAYRLSKNKVSLSDITSKIVFSRFGTAHSNETHRVLRWTGPI